MDKQPNLKKIEAEAAFKKERYDASYSSNKTAQDESTLASRRLERGVINNLSGDEVTHRYAVGLEEELAQLGNTAMEAVVTGHYLQFNEKKAAEHYQKNKDAYHELALIDAHKEGEVINVEQPLEIGQKIDVHTTQQPVHNLQPLLRRY